MNVAKSGRRITLIGKEISKTAKLNPFQIIENLCSHGVGNSLHEYPEDITNYYNRYDYRTLTEGLVITIEPFLSTNARSVNERNDGWTLFANKQNICSI